MTSTGRRTAIPEGQLRASDDQSDPALRHRVSSGVRSRGTGLHEHHRYLTDLRALIASIGPPCWAAGPTAAALHGFDGYRLAPPFHVVVPRGRWLHRIGHVIHTARSLERLDTVTVDGLPVTSPTRTIIDLAASETVERLTVAVDSATRDGGTSDDFLHRRLVALRTRGRAGLSTLLKVLDGIEVSRGGHSWLEREFLRLAALEQLPRPMTQQVVGRRGTKLIRVDCMFPGTKVVVELLGYTFHRTPMQLQNDAERMNRLVLDGLTPLQFTYLDVAERSPTMFPTIREALAR